MMMKIFMLTLTLFSQQVWSASAKNSDPEKKSCLLSVSPSSIQVSWRAFKTPKKIGVGGKFTEISVTNIPTKKTAVLSDLVKGVQFSINTSKISTGDEGRDQKVVTFFFNKMVKANIQGEVVSMEKGMLTLDLTINNVTRNIPLAFEKKVKLVTAKGFIDIFDFSLQESLKGINQACYDLHEGKTWSDVEVELQFVVDEQC